MQPGIQPEQLNRTGLGIKLIKEAQSIPISISIALSNAFLPWPPSATDLWTWSGSEECSGSRHPMRHGYSQSIEPEGMPAYHCGKTMHIHSESAEGCLLKDFQVISNNLQSECYQVKQIEPKQSN